MTDYVIYEKQYNTVMNQILKGGVRQKNERTGVETLRIPHAVFTIDLQKEFPILEAKKVYWKTAVKEILWIMQKQSNNIHDLNAHIWDEWADEQGSIGKAYGYQVAKEVRISKEESYVNQVSYILDRLQKDSSDRRAVIDLWNVDDIGDMRLCPCCYSSIWTVIDGKLNCMLIQRSADYLVGVPFNTTQYAVLTHLFARHLGIKPGILTHCMADAHIYCYDSHLDNTRKLQTNFEALDIARFRAKGFSMGTGKYPKLVINPDATIFWDVKLEDIQMENYNPLEDMKFEVAV